MMKRDFEKRVETMYKSVKDKITSSPQLGIVLGSGLSGLADAFPGSGIPYSDIAEFPKPTVTGHKGEMTVSDECLIMAGRFHYYEGHPIDDVILPIMLMHKIGITTVILTNAAGGINKGYSPGDLVIIKDHINLMGFNPLHGPNPSFGPRFPDMSAVYTPALREKAKKCVPYPFQEGIYLALSGPSYETPAEIRMLRNLGADMVGMSTVPEAITAGYLGMNVFGISCITNMAAGILDQPLNHEEVIATGKMVENTFKDVLQVLVREFGG